MGEDEAYAPLYDLELAIHLSEPKSSSSNNNANHRFKFAQALKTYKTTHAKEIIKRILCFTYQDLPKRTIAGNVLDMTTWTDNERKCWSLGHARPLGFTRWTLPTQAAGARGTGSVGFGAEEDGSVREADIVQPRATWEAGIVARRTTLERALINADGGSAQELGPEVQG